VLITASLALASCGSSSSSSAGGVRGASEVSAQPVSSSGTNPFTASVGTDKSGITPPAGAASSSGGPATYDASLPGLYGGTRNYRSCDAEKMITFLNQNPSKAAAWAQTLGIQTSQISDYVSGLTDVILRTDTRVTNHGYVDGHATTLQSVLEAGTAVFVDKYGRPVVKCYCGNPLTPPELLSEPTYTGPLWSGFSTTNITIIHQSIKIIDIFTLYDPTTGKTFPRYPGAHGRDGPYNGTTPPPLKGGNPTPPPSGQPGRRENPSVSLSPNPVTQGGTVTLSASGFAPGAALTITVNRPDGVVEHYPLTAGSDGSGTYTFSNAAGSAPLGTYNVTVSNPSTGAQASGSVDVVAPSGGSPSTPGSGTSTPGSGTSTPGSGTSTPGSGTSTPAP
jgi:hypothetical protein